MMIFLMVGAAPADKRDSNGQSLESDWSKNEPFGHNIPGDLKIDGLGDVRDQLVSPRGGNSPLLREVALELLTGSRPASGDTDP